MFVTYREYSNDKITDIRWMIFSLSIHHMSCIMLGDNDSVNITEVCLPPNTLRSDDYIIEVILESTGKTEKTNI